MMSARKGGALALIVHTLRRHFVLHERGLRSLTGPTGGERGIMTGSGLAPRVDVG